MEKALETVQQLITGHAGRDKRLSTLLRRHDALDTEDWYMCVPAMFNEALDIQRTERIVDGKSKLMWTQGSGFSFKSGDMLYDLSSAYTEWSKALKTINICIQIDNAVDSGPSEGANARFSGTAEFSVYCPNSDRSKIEKRFDYKMTHDDFVRFLIAGPERELADMVSKARN